MRSHLYNAKKRPFPAPCRVSLLTVEKLALAIIGRHPIVEPFSDRHTEVLIMANFGYGRVSTAQQDTENQRLELEQEGGRLTIGFRMSLAGKPLLCSAKHSQRCWARSGMMKRWLCKYPAYPVAAFW